MIIHPSNDHGNNHDYPGHDHQVMITQGNNYNDLSSDDQKDNNVDHFDD